MKHIKNFTQFNESIDNSDSYSSKQEQFDLKTPNSIEDVDKNVNYILSQYGNRKMAGIQVLEYLQEIGDLGKQYIVSNGIKSREELEKFCSKKQSIARKGKGLEKREIEDNFKKIKADYHLNNIMNMAMQQSAEMDK